MSNEFDPYYQFLGIPKCQRPPHHYQLLGVALFESNAEVIANAADRQMRYLRSLNAGPYSSYAQKLLDEVARAKLCLVREDRRHQYDADLRAQGITISASGSTQSAVPQEPGSAIAQTVGAVQKSKMANRTADELPTRVDSVPRYTIGPPDGVPPEVVFTQVRVGTESSGRELNAVNPCKKTVTESHFVEVDPEDKPLESDSAKMGNIRRVWVIGSDDDCDIVVPRDVVSKRHCKLYDTTEGFFVEDLRSTNGTFVNRRRIQGPVRVKPRDRITLGQKSLMPWPEDARERKHMPS